MTCSDKLMVCVQRMVVAVRLSQGFVEDMVYALSAAFVERGAAVSY